MTDPISKPTRRRRPARATANGTAVANRHTGMVTPPLGSVAANAQSVDGARRSEILQIAADLFAASGYVRTSLKDVADACGILPGSLYHHFDSKQAIATELLERYWAALDEVGRASLAEAPAEAGPPITPARPITERVGALGAAIAECGVQHSAALQLSTYEPHAGAPRELVELARRRPVGITGAMRRVLDDGLARGELKPDVDLAFLAEQLCVTMLHVGLARLHRDGSPAETAVLLCSMLLEGIAAQPPTDAVLDRSAAMAAAVASVADWAKEAGRDDRDVDDRKSVLRVVARAEFARRGYEATTIRDIASAAGMGTGSVYRLIDSKEALLASIMNAYYNKLSAGYLAVARSRADPLAKIDALTWLNINVIDQFAEEFEIQQAWFRSFPPETSSLADSLKDRSRHIRDIVAEALKEGELRFGESDVDTLTDCVRDLIWIPPTVIRQTDHRQVLEHSRATLFRGAAGT